ncbi:MAG: hypothetical protein WKF83_00480 [Nocardioidaceae bacterium]
MLGSPNHIISVYDASERPSALVPPGSIETEQAFRKYFDAVEQPVTDDSRRLRPAGSPTVPPTPTFTARTAGGPFPHKPEAAVVQPGPVDLS